MTGTQSRGNAHSALERVRQAARKDKKARFTVLFHLPTMGGSQVLVVGDAIHGLPVENVDALANPQALEHFRDLAVLQS